MAVEEKEAQLVNESLTNKLQLRESQRLRGRKRSATDSSMPAKKQRRKSENTTNPFSCDICKATSIINNSRSRAGGKADVSTVKRPPGRRHKVDPDTGKLLTLCNACGLKFGRKTKRPTIFSESQREKFVSDTKQFVQSLVDTLKDDKAAHLCCTNVYKTGACGCVQKFLHEDNSDEVDFAQARLLLQLSKEAQQLATEKYLLPGQTVCVGLGAGHKRSDNYVTFIQQQRWRLREEYRLCEKATQRILRYSNNFLYKKLKTMEGKCRVRKKHGKLVLGKLKPIDALAGEMCCSNRCTELASSKSTILEDWRCRYRRGEQAECRLVISEMLTHNDTSHSICVRFIQLVTGASLSVVEAVQTTTREADTTMMPKTCTKRRQQIEVSNEISQQETESLESNTSHHHVLEPASVVQCPDNVTMAIRQLLSCESSANQTNNIDHSTSTTYYQCLGPAAMQLFAAEAASCVNQEQRNCIARQDLHQTTNPISSPTVDNTVVAESVTASMRLPPDAQPLENPYNLVSSRDTMGQDCFEIPSPQYVCQTEAEGLVNALETLTAMMIK